MNTAHAIESLYATGYWLLEQSRYADAASVFRTMLVAAPTDERSWLALGACHEAAGQTAIAEKLYRSGVEVASPPVRCAVAQARTLRALGRDEEADLAFDRAEALASELDGEAGAVVANARRTP
jgi:tetratricopeptide (TPR) repeat protein